MHDPHDAHRSWRARLVDAWDAVQVELHGCYSVGRLRAFQHYAAHTTHTRTCLVLVLTPLPCLVAVAFADCIPLAPPELGIVHSTGFWVRACFASWVYSYSIMEQLRCFIPELPLTAWTTLALSIPVMALTNAVTFLLAFAIGYPMPFTIPVISMPWATFMVAALWLQLRTFLRQHPEKRRPLVQFVCVVLCQMSLLVIYPAYNAVFYNLSAGAQVLFALLLPIIKLVEKNVMSLFLDRVEDLKPEQIIFNVEIFNALFIACCMQNSNSIAVNFVLVGVDFTMACISLRDLDAILQEVHELARKMHVDPTQLQENVIALCQGYPQLESQGTQKLLLERIRNARSRSRSRSRDQSQNRNPRVLRVPRPSGIIVPIRYELQPSNAPATNVEHARSPWSWLKNLPWRVWPAPESNPVTRTAVGGWVDAKGGRQRLFTSVLAFGSEARIGVGTPHGDTEPSSRLRSTIASTIASLGVLKIVFPERVLADADEVSVAPIETRVMMAVELLTEDERLCFLEKSLQTLHLTEYLLLIEYVEVMIPIVYSIYLIVLFHLPNRTFYPQLRDMDEMSLQRTVRNVMMNAIFEFVSLLLLVRVLKRKLHISPLRQLAFVLDRQWRMVQSKVVLWVVVTLQSTLYHLGADYSFKFAWLHHNQSSRAPPPR